MRTRSKLSILLSVLLCCTMLAGLLPTVAFAEDSTTVSSENGADTSSKNSADTSSKNSADTTSENGADTTPENGTGTSSENGAGTSSENGTAAPAAAPSAAPSVAWIGETGYPTLEEAVNAAASGDTIVLGEGNSRFTKKVQIQKEKTSHLWGREPIKPHGALVQRCLIRLILGRNTMAIIVSTAPAQSHFGI